MSINSDRLAVDIAAFGLKVYAPRQKRRLFSGGEKSRISFSDQLDDMYKVHAKVYKTSTLMGHSSNTPPKITKVLGRIVAVPLLVQIEGKDDPCWVKVNVGSLKRLGLSRQHVIQAAKNGILENEIRTAKFNVEQAEKAINIPSDIDSWENDIPPPKGSSDHSERSQKNKSRSKPSKETYSSFLKPRAKSKRK